MCDRNALRSAVKIAIDSLVGLGSMFTAYDITCAIRAQVGRAVNIPHADVRQLVYGMYNDGLMTSNYDRTNVTFGNGVEAMVFHPYTSDPQTHTLRDSAPSSAPVTTLPATVAAPQGIPHGSLTQLSGNTTSGADFGTALTVPSTSATRHMNGSVYQPDNRGRIRTPKALMDQAGFNPGDTAWLVVDNGTIVLLRNAPAGVAAKPLTTDAYNNVLFKAPIDANGYKFSVNANSVQITAVP